MLHVISPPARLRMNGAQGQLPPESVPDHERVFFAAGS